MLPIFLNQLSVTSASINTPGTGVWIADLDIDLDVSGIVPSGRAVLTIGTSILNGTIDPRASGKFGAKGHVQLVGGGGGWDTIIPSQPFVADFGVLSTQVYSATAALVGEVVADSVPKILGKYFTRTAGPASRVLAGVDWYVNNAGVTIVGPRIPQPFNPLSIDILEWDPDTRRAVLASDELVQPGTILLDLRFGTATIRDVEQTFGPEGARCIAWCATSDLPAVPGLPATEVAGSRLARAIGALAREATSSATLRQYRYRVAVQEPDKRLTLQSIDPLTAPVPPILPSVEMWPGIPGASALVTPGTEVLVVFLDGAPYVVAFANLLPPIELTLDALKVSVGLGTSPVVQSVGFLAWASKIEGLLSSLGAPVPPPLAVATPSLVSTKLFTD